MNQLLQGQKSQKVNSLKFCFVSRVFTRFIQIVILSFWDPVEHLQGCLGPSGPETPKKSEKSLLGPPALGPPESLKSETKVFADSRDFFQTLGGGSRAPEDSDFFGVSGGPGGPEKPL